MSITVKRRPTALSPTPASLASPRATAPAPVPKSASAVSAPPSSYRQRRGDLIRDLAPIISEIRKAGYHSNAEIAERLNAIGLRAPTGGAFSTETTRRIQKEIKLLGLGNGPRTVSAALEARAAKNRARAAVVFAEIEARRRREHPEWFEGIHDPTSKPAR